jgi:hypothetical protein
VPILSGAPNADWTVTLGHVRDHYDFRAARHAPPLAKDVEFDLAEA